MAAIEYISSPARGDTYRRNETISVRVVFDKAVATNGASFLPLTIGARTRFAFQFAAHRQFIGFRYTVQADDLDTDGIEIAADAFVVAAGTVKDAADGTTDAVLTHGALPADPTRKVNGAESPAGVVISPRELAIPEGGAASYTVVLAWPPAADVRVAVARAAGSDEDLTASPAELTFTRASWSTAQAVTISAAGDDDAAGGTATFTHTASSADAEYDGIAIAGVAATEDDDDFEHGIPLFPLASDPNRQGFARVVNHSDEPGEVRIEGIDDTGARYGPLTLVLGARETRHFDSGDLARGDPSKGMTGGFGGDGVGSWRLRLVTNLDIEPLAYVRTEDGFLTPVHDVAGASALAGTTRHHVPFLNPASNQTQRSALRLMSRSGEAVAVTITGTDDDGAPAPGGEVVLTLPAGEVRTLTSRQLESGGDGLTGALGDGRGKWRLSVAAGGPIEVMSLLRSPTGHLTNVSAPGRRRAAGAASALALPLFAPATNRMQQGFARLVNHSEETATVRIYGIDDAGTRHGPVGLSLRPGAAARFNSRDLEQGNPSKGLSGRLGDGQGDWRLTVHADSDVEALAYVRTTSGFVASMHEFAYRTATGYHVPLFNPAGDRGPRSRLRLTNPNAEPAEVTISGRDDAGEEAPAGQGEPRAPGRRRADDLRPPARVRR